MTYDKDELAKLRGEFSLDGQKYLKAGNGSIAGHDDEWIYLKNVVCHDSDGDITEEYPELKVRRSYMYSGEVMPSSAYDLEHIAGSIEQNEMFLPSMALTCKVHTIMYDELRDGKPDKKLAGILEGHLSEYYTGDQGERCFIQNTIVDYESKRIIHYPRAEDFGGDSDFNLNTFRTELFYPEVKMENGFMRIDMVCDKYLDFMRSFTGIEEPRDLCEIAEKTFKNQIINEYQKPICGRFKDLGIGFIGNDKGTNWIMTGRPKRIYVRGYQR